MSGSEAGDGAGASSDDSGSKDVPETHPEAEIGSAADEGRRKAPVIRKIAGPRLPRLQPAICSGSTPPGAHAPPAACALNRTMLTLTKYTQPNRRSTINARDCHARLPYTS